MSRGRARVPDVVVCDLGLPEMDGHEIVRTLRRDARFHGVLFVALSGRALPEDVERCEAAGFDHHVSTPPRIE